MPTGAGLTSLITQVSDALHAANPHWQVTMATYASAAADRAGFYDIAALAPALDGFFVMAYDMNDPGDPSATAPLVGGGLHRHRGPAAVHRGGAATKVILGVPYYGYDWPTTDGTGHAPRPPGGETPLSYARDRRGGQSHLLGPGHPDAVDLVPGGRPSGTRRTSTTRRRWP